MTKYNFDNIIDRKSTDCLKADALKRRYGREDLTSLWVADMDFRTPDFIVAAIRKRCEHEIFGYTYASDDYYNSIIEWVDYKHNWKIKREWLTYIPGIVKGIGFVIQFYTKPGDKVIIQPPVYHPFRLVPHGMGREVVNNPLKLVDGCYEMDFEQLESIIDDNCKVLILCNPHNPAGIVWTKETLIKLADICAKHNILVVSDEIHSEMVYPQSTHQPFATASESAAAISITFMAPSKTFNIAGIVSSYAIVPNDNLRRSFYHFLDAGELSDGTIFAYTATIAAYKHGADWLKQMLGYVMENVRFVDEFIKKNITGIEVYKPQASFLVWLDCRGLGLSHDDLIDLFVNKAKLALNDGEMFGPGGKGYMRINVGCSRLILEQALTSLTLAINEK